MLNFTDAELKSTRFYQDVYGEGKGEGKIEGELNSTLLVCKVRYGDIEPAIIEKIELLGHEQLKTLLTLLVANEE